MAARVDSHHSFPHLSLPFIVDEAAYALIKNFSLLTLNFYKILSQSYIMFSANNNIIRKFHDARNHITSQLSFDNMKKSGVKAI